MRFTEGSPGQGTSEKQEQGLEKPLPVGVSPQMHAFHLDVKKYSAYRHLDQRKKTLFDRYFNEDVSTTGLRRMAGVTSKQGVYYLIRRSLEIVYESLPPNISAKYAKEEVARLKDRAAMSAKASRDNPRTHTAETSERMSRSQRERRLRESLNTQRVTLDVKTSQDPS